MSATVLFLDIDGVLNDDAWVTAACAGQGAITRWSLDLARRCLDPARCERLQRVCDKTGASLVIVSGWRRWATVEEIADALRGAGLTAPVLGAVGGVKMSGDLRASATREWLRDRPEVTRWCVVDDLVDAWREGRHTTRREGRTVVELHERVVPAWLAGRCVHPRDGLTDDDAARVAAILRGEVTT